MKTLLLLATLLMLTGCQYGYGSHSNRLTPNAYGPGVHMDEYGRPVKLYTPNGVPGEQVQIKPNAYGPGVHMDQYGRPVYSVPAF